MEFEIDTNELIYRTEADSQRIDLWLPRERLAGRDGLGAWDYAK